MGKIQVFSSAAPNYLRYEFDDQTIENLASGDCLAQGRTLVVAMDANGAIAPSPSI